MIAVAETDMISGTTNAWRLKFMSLMPEDLGLYTCEAGNDLSDAIGEITLSR